MKYITPLIYSPKGFAKPRFAKTYIDTGFKDVQQWFFEKLGVTFKLNNPLSFMGRETWADIGTRYADNYKDNGFNIWRDAMLDIKSRNVINLCSPNRGLYLIYFHPPIAWGEGNPVGMGGMVGNENWGCASPRPGTGCMGDRMTYLLAGKTSEQIEAMGWPYAWPNSPNHPKGGIAHEIVHMFTNLPHSTAIGNQILEEWYAFPDTGFTDEEAIIVKAALA
jgi:hypothetical protein